ncbi:hypothetical protein [Shinella sp.]|uniref:hypothetical protein n=1 Tax=Shinella sp. TaxID=1870904 RepID=UPI0040362BC7
MIAQLENWYTCEISSGVDVNLPGIYEWKIEGVGSYIGRYTRRSRPFKEYERNVLKLLNGRPYRPAKPDKFRAIHRALFAAHTEGRHITLIILENCAPSELNEREAVHIIDRGVLNGPITRVLRIRT